MDVLRSSGSATVADLAMTLEVTEATVRRRLQRLAREGRLIRTYGGATVVEGGSLPVTADEDPNIAYKRAVGTAAAGLIEDGSTIALSSGTTVVEMARRLRHRHLTVITNALDVANALLDAPAVELIVLGGVVLPTMHSTRGHLTESALRDLRADTVFMGASAIDLDNGFMTEQVRRSQWIEGFSGRWPVRRSSSPTPASSTGSRLGSCLDSTESERSSRTSAFPRTSSKRSQLAVREWSSEGRRGCRYSSIDATGG